MTNTSNWALTLTFYLLMQWSENFAFDLNTEESIFSKYFNYSLAFIKSYPLLQLSHKLEVPFIFLYQDLQVCRFDYCVLASYFVHCLVLPQLRSSYAHSQQWGSLCELLCFKTRYQRKASFSMDNFSRLERTVSLTFIWYW